MDNVDRKPNPPGWTQPKAPYNPYDTADARPPQGYPSEFTTPGVKKHFGGKVAQDSTDFSRMRIEMKKLQYFPRPPSELYPGKYKVLRRIKHLSNFDRGATLTGKLSIYGIILFTVFFYKWNEHENIFAPFRRAQLRVKEVVIGELSKEEYNDLHPHETSIQQKPLANPVYEHAVEEQMMGTKDQTEYMKDRFAVKHSVQAEHEKQQEEAGLYKAMEMAERQLELKNKLKDSTTNPSSSSSSENKKPFWKFW